MFPYFLNLAFELVKKNVTIGGLLVICVLLVFLRSFPGSFAMALGLAEMQKSATENREIIKRYRIMVEKSNQEVERVRSAYYPSLDISVIVQTVWIIQLPMNIETTAPYTQLSV